MPKIIRTFVYVVLFGLIIWAFIYLGNKYANNSQPEVKKMSDFYSFIDSDFYEVINGTRMINKIKSGNNLIFVGSSTSKWSIKYVEELDVILSKLGVDKVYYYDINNDKAQKNSNYYDIRELLKGYLVTTDGGESNLLAPSFYIVLDGKVLYYNTETVAMKNTTSIDDYWNKEQEINFAAEIENAVFNYYLNN